LDVILALCLVELPQEVCMVGCGSVLRFLDRISE